MTNPLFEVMTFSEAAELWGFADGATLRKAQLERRLIDGQDCRRSGGTWIISTVAMTRVFGQSLLEKAGFEPCGGGCWVKILTGDELKLFFDTTPVRQGTTHCALEVYTSGRHAQYALFGHLPTESEMIAAMALPQITDYDQVLQWAKLLTAQ